MLELINLDQQMHHLQVDLVVFTYDHDSFFFFLKK
jgi:hypothetical protein